MKIDLSEAIEARIGEFLETSLETSEDEDLNSAVRSHRFLPLYFGITVAHGVRPDGSVVTRNELEARVEVVTSPFWRRMVLFQGSKRYPELSALVPEEPPEARRCSGCSGTGIFERFPLATCWCGGLGWEIPGESKD
ncbi:MAG: hypothetical protein AAF533_10925 [Acidobacteriota bacterium]